MRPRLPLLLFAVLLAQGDCQTPATQGTDSPSPTSQGTDASPTNVPAASRTSASAITSSSVLPAAISSQTDPTLPTTFTAFTANSTNGETGGASDWLGSILAFANLLANAPELQAAAENSSQAVTSLMGQLPGLVQGLGAANLQGNDAAQLLAGLFSDPRAADIPAWIEALVDPDINTSQSLQDAQTLLQSLSQLDPNDQLQTLLSSVFTDVTQGLQSLNVTANSTSQDVISAMMNDPGLMSSLSSDALQMIGVIGGSEMLQQLLQQQFPVDPESQCSADLSAFGSGLEQGHMWALQMLDATGKLQAGLLTGAMALFGDYDECLQISHVNGSHTIQGQFCGVAMAVPGFMAYNPAVMEMATMGLHLCLPKSCATPEQIYFLLQPTIEALGSEFQGVYCYPKPDPSGDPWFTGTMVTLGILALLCATGTAYAAVLDYKKDRQKGSPVKVTSNGHTNNVYTNNAYTKEDGAHLNGGLINGQVSDKEKAVVDTEKAVVDKEVKDDGVHINDGLINGQVNDKEKAIADTEKAVVETGMTNGQNGCVEMKNGLTNGQVDNKEMAQVDAGLTNGQNGSVGLKDAVVNGKSEGMKTVNGTAKIGGERPSSEDSLPSQLLLSFSVLRNGRKVLNCDKNSADISCLHGIRVLSITWIVLGHVYVMILATVGNQSSTWLLFERFTHMGIVGAVLGVDTFFMLSGCLSAFLFLRTTKKTGLTVSGVVLYYIHRVWRLTPLYAVVLLVYTGIFPYLKEGPFQNVLGMDSESNCRHYMHFNLLYVNNLVDVNKMCLGWSWYLSNDMQFSFLAPLVIIPWCFGGRVKVVGFVLAAAMIATHCITTGVKVADLGSTFAPDYTEEVYFKPWCRVGPYAVGLILGYILHVTRCKYTMTKMSWILGWTMATAVGLTLVYVVLDNYANFTTEGQSWGAADFAAYESLSRVLWAVCVSWVVFACTTGYGGFVNTLLSWSAWTPLSRLSYGVYLVHIIVQYVMAGNAKKYIYLDNWTATELNLSTIVLSFLLAFLFSMLVEAPTLGLEKAVLGRIFGKRK